ncbi:MAG: hypothetical protein Q8942_18315 [Bacillota bacterium]|nr:hypothetical protein [Bacillota bacterium]
MLNKFKKFYVSLILLIAALAMLCVNSFAVTGLQLSSLEISPKIIPVKKLVDVQKINIAVSNYLKSQTSISSVGSTSIKPVFLPENTTSTPDYLVTYIMDSNTYYYETKKISLNPDYSIRGVTDNYIESIVDLDVVDLRPILVLSADNDIDAVFGTCNDDIPSAVDGVLQAAATARAAGYKVKTLIGDEATVSAYKYWLKKPNVKIFGNIGHGSPNGIKLADGALEYSFFNSLGESVLNNKVLYFNSCQVHNYPLEASITGFAAAQKFIGGNINLGIGSSERVFKRFWELTLKNRSGMAESLSQAERDTGYSPSGAHGISGNGSNYVTNGNLAPQGTIISTVTSPTGSGNHDISIIRDGVKPSVGSDDSSTQFDTFTGNISTHYEYVGYTFNRKFTFGRLVFQEGKHFWDGGWFAYGAPTVQVRQNGYWYNVTSAPTTAYPYGNSASNFGSSYQSYTYNLNNVPGDGIRIYGLAGGANNFISVGEIQVYEGNQGNIIASVTNPTGGGNHNIEVINDAEIPAVGNSDSAMQYDTFVGNTAAHDEYIGYTYNENKTFTKVVFQEGKHFWDGGWFAYGAPKIQVRENGVWTNVTPTVSPYYPYSNSTSTFGSSYETYTYYLNNEVGNGIRLSGRAGGSNNFISVGELVIYGD